MKRKLFEEKQGSKLDCDDNAEIEHESTEEHSELEPEGCYSTGESDTVYGKSITGKA